MGQGGLPDTTRAHKQQVRQDVAALLACLNEDPELLDQCALADIELSQRLGA